jgi:Cd2+/Zn2+-exporting ATPase
MAERVAYRVYGLDCAEEVNVLRGALAGKPGILSVDFDVLNARMTVTYDPAAATPGSIIAQVAATGMRAVPWERRAELAESFWQVHGRLVMTCASGLLLALGFLAHWVAHRSLLDALVGVHGAGGHTLPVASILLYWAATLAGAWFVIPRAAASASRLRPDMNLLMVVAIAGAMGIGDWFEAATVAFLFSVALMLEHWSVGRARRAIKGLMDLSPPRAHCVDTDSGDTVERPVEEVPMGTLVVVRPGERIPLDGKVVASSSMVNEAPITGESKPVAKGPADSVFAGSINESDTLRFEVTKPARDTTLAHIIHLVEESQERRAPSEQWVEAFARYYTPLVMALAVAVAVAPPLLSGEPWLEWFYRGLVLLVIACPCALVISTPVSIVSALTSAARNGALIKGGAYLEAVGRLQALAMDKTGTLTHGRPEVQRVVPLNDHTAAGILERAAAIEVDSVHPLADAILRKATGDQLRVRMPEAFTSFQGRGAEAVVNGKLYWIGSHRMMHERGQETPQAHEAAEQLEDAGHSVVAVGTEDHVCGLISVADGLREDSRQVVAELKQLGVRRILMLTGDNEGTARAVAEASGVDGFRAELLPEDKVQAVVALAREFGTTAMVGDGVNDAPAMAAAHIGIAMGAIGADVAIETADITLMSDELARLPWLIRHSRRALRTVKQNVAFSLGVKALFIVLSMLGVATLWLAIAADTGASLLVTMNGLRMLRLGRRS